MAGASIKRILEPVHRFIHQEYTSGIILLLSVVVAIIWANSPWHESYHHLWETKFSLALGEYKFERPLHVWINDGLMALFFFVIGLELKREFMAGELSSFQKAALPMVAALGGMIVPALIYTFFNHNTDAAGGWGIPMATDIAFALALLSIAGKHIPPGVKVFLSALAVADDLGAVLVIAFFYTAQITLVPLLMGGLLLLLLLLGNRMGIRNSFFYMVVGLAVWYCFLLSGVHATIAGVLVAFTIPARTRINETEYAQNVRTYAADFEKNIWPETPLTTQVQHHAIEKIKQFSLDAETPLQKIEYALHPWVAFGIMPIFALANAGIVIGGNFFELLLNAVSLGVITGLVAGKFLGVLGFTWVMVRVKWAKLPSRATWYHMTGVAALAGVGFTMSLFITGLAFNSIDLIEKAKYGILIASLIAGVTGLLLLKSRAAKRVS